MRLLFVSDTQLGGGATYGTEERPRLDDQAAALDFISDVAFMRQVDAVVFAGDAFQHRKPAIDELLVFKTWLANLPNSVVLIVGNHDARGPDLSTTLDLFAEDWSHVYGRPGRHVFTDHDVTLSLLPWSHPGPLRAAGQGFDTDDHADALLRVAADLFEEARTTTRILVTHHALSGMSLPTGLPTGLMGEPVLDTRALLDQGWSWVMAGHVHAPAIVTTVDGRQAVSLGSPWVQDFGEADVEHGVWLLDTDSDELEYIEVPGRRFVTIDEHASAAWITTDTGDVGNLGVFELADAVVRVRLSGTEEEVERVDVGRLTELLVSKAGAHKVHEVAFDVTRTVRARAEELQDDIGPLDAVDEWARAVGLPADDHEGLRELTAIYLREE